jgi:hydroxylamine dehydrogenase
MKPYIFAFLVLFLSVRPATGADFPISEDTQTCLFCHRAATPGIVADWERGRMARITPEAAKSMIPLKRRVSFETIPEKLSQVGVGCAECHTLTPEKHPDSFEHNGYQVHVVVTPEDCAVCHPVEREQYAKNLMSQAYGNLQHNAVYRSLADAVNGVQHVRNNEIVLDKPDQQTDADSCFYCHGTVVEVTDLVSRETDFGDMDFPVLSGWPNHGVGRINPDKSQGACSACHTRHQFSIEMARKPYTCSECHKGPDVPAYQVYQVSKHGNIVSAMSKDKHWDFNAVPWTIGDDFTAPTCATCHVSLLVAGDRDVVAERTHQMSDRMAWRIFGLVYAHPQPKSPDTTIIRNAAGLPLPTELTGEPAAAFLIDQKEQDKRQKTMQNICLSCHSRHWVEAHYARFHNAIQYTNDMTLTATKILLDAWEKGAAKGLAQNDSIFNEAIEKKWVEQWLFFANSTRYASAMAGADYGAFANGRWYLSKNIQEMVDWLEFRLQTDR